MGYFYCYCALLWISWCNGIGGAGYSALATATNNYGLLGYAYGHATNYGVYGLASGGTTNWAGYFMGRAKVTDSLTIGTITIPPVDGTTGQVLKTNGAGKLSWYNESITSPASPAGSVQFNNSGAFGGDANLFWDNTNKRLE